MSYVPPKIQAYPNDGHGRDSYIFNNNGGFGAPKEPTKVHPVSNFVTQRQRPSSSLATIHSKPVIYKNNGGGRDTYISCNNGGFRPLQRAGECKSTYFTTLRAYPSTSCIGQHKPLKPTSQMMQKYINLVRQDEFSAAQNSYSSKFNLQMSKVKGYQTMLDKRLSKPKNLQAKQTIVNDRNKVFRNSSPPQIDKSFEKVKPHSAFRTVQPSARLSQSVMERQYSAYGKVRRNVA